MCAPERDMPLQIKIRFCVFRWTMQALSLQKGKNTYCRGLACQTQQQSAIKI